MFADNSDKKPFQKCLTQLHNRIFVIHSSHILNHLMEAVNVSVISSELF